MLAPIKEYTDSIIRRIMQANEQPFKEGISPKANTVSEYFYGYPYIVNWQPQVKYNYLNIQKLSLSARQWLKENNIEYTDGIRLVVWSDSISGKEEWVINDIAGEERWFWAFKNEQDAIMFSLRW